MNEHDDDMASADDDLASADDGRVRLDDLRFDDRGLITVVVQDAENGDVLMVAWSNREALERTVAEGRMVYWSRSRRELWRKGDTSGHVQHWDELRADCDGDVVLALVHQEGAACHTGRRSCFFRTIEGTTPDGEARLGDLGQ